MPPIRQQAVDGDAATAEASSAYVRAGRSPAEQVVSTARLLQSVPLFTQMLDALPLMAMVVNERRQAVAVNRVLREAVGRDEFRLLGLRPGEMVGCLHSDEGEDGCGTAPACEVCGAVEAIEAALIMQQPAVREARLRRALPGGEQWLDVRVTAHPFTWNGMLLALVVLEDISQAKRLEVLGRVFFHDVLNTVGCVAGYVRCLSELSEADWSAALATLSQLTVDLTEEIEAHRDLLAAESGYLTIDLLRIELRPLLRDLREQYARHHVAMQRNIALVMSNCPADPQDGAVRTDARLLRRVLGNMLKNALEAVPPGATVTLGCECTAERVRLSVHNPGVMPPKVQQQVFERSFSTKAERGRGIGTYSMKLLGERYLGGKVSFVSSEAEGTKFFLELPKH